MAFILSLLTYIPGLSKLFQWLASVGLQFYSAKLQAEGSHEAKVAELAQKELDLAGLEDRLNAQQKALTIGKWYEPEHLAAYLVLLPYLGKAVLWDTVVGSFYSYQPHWLFYTAPVEGTTSEMVVLVATFWFGGRAIMSAGKSLVSAWKA